MKDIRFEKILKHCCDTAWEYNSDSGKIYVHYDVLYPNMVGKSYSPEEVRDIFLKKYLCPIIRYGRIICHLLRWRIF